jgi:integrase/recombinase XerD
MAQAKTLTERELKKVLDYVRYRPNGPRDRLMLLMTVWSGLRVGEVASLTLRDVLDTEGRVKDEIHLDRNRTKGKHARTVFLPRKLRDEIRYFLEPTNSSDRDTPLFLTRRCGPFSANTLTQHFFHLYRRAGVEGASSHSGRRSFITNLANRAISIKVISTLARHSDVSVTSRYISVNDEQLRAAVEFV